MINASSGVAKERRNEKVSLFNLSWSRILFFLFIQMNMNLPPSFVTVPCQGKVPTVGWKQFIDRAPTEEEQRQWGVSRDAGKAIICGPVSKLFVLDDDGSEELKKYSLPRTATVRTPRGGRHYYFKWINTLNDKVTTGIEILPKVDVRGHGGIVAFYGWEKPPTMIPLAQPPQWLIDLLPNREQQAPDVPKPDSWMLDELNAIEPGNGRKGRTPTFIRVIGKLKQEGSSQGSILAALSSWAEKYDYTRLNSLIADQFKRYPVQQQSQIEGQGSSIEHFLENMEVIDWICKPLIAKQTLGFVAGLPETGKTWMMIDLAVECARGGGMWLKRFPVKGCKVLFIDQERFKGETQRRFRAVIAAKNLDPKDLKDNLYIRSGTTTRINLDNSYQALRKEIADIQPNLIIVDSFVSFHTKEENNRKDIQEVLERIKQLRNEFGCTFLFIDHENKGVFHDKETEEQPSAMRMAGSVGKPAAAELVLTVRKQDAESCFVYNTKNTLSGTIPPFLVKVTDVDSEKTKIIVEAF